MWKRSGILLLCAALSLIQITSARAANTVPPAHVFAVQGDRFILDGKPFVIRAGELHYQRIPREHWRSRLRMARAMGLNTIGAYLFWNALEPQPGQFDFSGNNDIAEFVRIAQQEGLWVMLRPGPYSCAEWEFGGFPSWLLRTPDIKVRTTDLRFLGMAQRYLKKVGEQLAPLQIGHGGPILMTQVENEYGSFGNDKTYLNAIRQALRDGGFDGVLYTVDGDTEKVLTDGTLPDVLAATNFPADPQKSFAALEKLRPGQPVFNGEYYPGWFDNWGGEHHARAVDAMLADMKWFLDQKASFSIYMFHGGTSFGYMNGANNFEKEGYTPQTTSYDYDAPLDEAGRPTHKYFVLRELIGKHLSSGETLPPVPVAPKLVGFARIDLNESAPLSQLLGAPVESERPLTFEALGQNYGFVLYRTMPSAAARGKLEVDETRDYALVMQGEKVFGKLDRRLSEKALDVSLEAGRPLDILVENMGRVNYGKNMLDGFSGITHKVTLNGQEMKNWKMYSLPLDDLSALKFSSSQASETGPRFWRGTFMLKELGDTFVDTRGWNKGHVWVNGHHLGRYWKIGPQQTLYAPAEWLHAGENQMVVFEEHPGGVHSVQGLTDPVFDASK